MAPGIDEDDVIFPGDERTCCGKKECFLVAGHAGRCQRPQGRGRRGPRQKRRQRQHSGEGSSSDSGSDDDEEKEANTVKQREDRLSRWSRRQWGDG